MPFLVVYIYYIYIYICNIYIYITYLVWRQCPTPTVYAQKAKINSSDINGYRLTLAMFDYRKYGNTRKLTDIGRRSLSVVRQYRTAKQDKWKRPLRLC